MNVRQFMASLIIILTVSSGRAETENERFKIASLPRLAQGLKPGTIAWATIDQLHPTQPQTGKREVKRKVKEVLNLLPNGDREFPKKLFRFFLAEEIVPVFVGKTSPEDSRYGTEKVLGFVTDHHHESNAVSNAYEKVYGKRSLREPIYDKKGRPINFVIVKIDGDRSDLSPEDFAQFMTKEKHGYLKNWSRDSDGKTVVEKIDFRDLPERMSEMTDNPYRALVGEEQHEHNLDRSPTEFSQFVDAEGLLEHHVAEWDDINLDASDKSWKKAIVRAKKFFKSEEAAGLPGARRSKVSRSCAVLFKK